jgi:Ca-activated chloride channel family protein
MTRSTVAVLLGGLLLSIPAAPQQKQPPGQQPPPPPGQPAPQPPPQRPATTFTTSHDEVILPVTVTDIKSGKFVSNLEKDDFRIQDEGRTQKITYFYHDTVGMRQHTVIGFLVDMSSGNLSHWDKFKDATKEMIWGLLPNDPNYTGYLISYSTMAELVVNTTYDPDKLTDQVDRMKPGGGASLYNAIYMACTDRTLVPGEPYQPRRVIIIIGDGHDTASQYTLDQAIELAQRNLVTIYGVSTVAFGGSSDDSDNLERLAKETGGHVEYPLSDPYSNVSGYLSQPSDEGNYALHVGTGGYASAIAQAINTSVQALEGELTTQYILRYVPDIDPATSYRDKRRLKVEIPTLPANSVKLQYRPYYYANSLPTNK